MTFDYLIFTDLDGTLLDHDSYSYEAALPALRMLAEADCPLIFNSSKTATEIAQLRNELQNHHPFIVENGSAVYIPDGYFEMQNSSARKSSETLSVHSFGPGYRELLETLHTLRSQHGYLFQGFADLSPDDVAELTGLSSANAARAKDRAASEPLVWQGDEKALEEFKNDLESQGLTLTRGGRFYHVMGQTSKASALLWLAEKYRASWPDRAWQTVALGDGPNDREMLEAADIAVVIKAASGRHLEIDKSGQVICPEEPGPRGWQYAIETIFQQSSHKGV